MKLESIVNYKGEVIMIWRVADGWMKGTIVYSYGNREYKTFKEAKAVIDSCKKPWRIYRGSTGENNIIGNLLWKTLAEIHNGRILDVNTDERYVIVE